MKDDGVSRDVELSRIEMRFGEALAVRDVSLTVEAGEFFSILGPSGCGKTTVLRLVGGFLEPTRGTIKIGGQDMRGLGPNRRPTVMIFQNLALFPLMPVWENVAFGLEARGLPKRERRSRAEALLNLVALPGLADRKIDELSGGQKQRVAIARALAVEPQVLLLDEPLSALDLKLRQHMRAELRAIQKRTGVTFLYITHDQSEALAMSDRVGVMNRGELHQIGRPEEIYDRPATSFVASFVGETNAFEGRVGQVADGRAALETPLGVFVGQALRPLSAGGRATLYVRPERLTLNGGAENRISVTITRRDFEGASAMLLGRAANGQEITVQALAFEASLPKIGEEAALAFRAADAAILPAAADA